MPSLKRLFPTLLLILFVVALSSVTAAQDDYQESPVLARRVRADQLPPVAERLPENPAVVTPLVEPGKYGGTMRFGFVGTNVGWGGMWYVTGWENLVIWAPDFSGVVPNIAESWEVSDDVREYTFFLREGMKWSDGAPFTADDIMFYVEDVLFNLELNGSGPVADWLPPDGAADFQAEKLDDFTVKFKFKNPYGTFLYNLATWSGRHITFFPKHYLSQFHAAYNEDIDELVEQEGLPNWAALFNVKASGPTTDTQEFYHQPARPTLFPWIVTEPLGDDTTIVLERNPFYWKVDSDGNQLPYIDRIVGTSFEDNESRTLAMLGGELDFVKDPGNGNRVIYFEAMDTGAPINISLPVSDSANTNSIHFNRTLADRQKAEIFANKDFRIGMSYAINRREIIEVVHLGQGKPAQVAPLETSPLYNEEMATQYTEYDLEKAEEYLDKVLPRKDSAGFRLGKDGKRFSFILSFPNDLSYTSAWESVARLLIQGWQKVGIEAILETIPNDEFNVKKELNTIEAALFTGEGGAGLTAILDPRYYVPFEYYGLFGNGWFGWFRSLPNATIAEPPQNIKDMRAAYEAVLAEPTQQGQIDAMRELLKQSAEEFFVIGISRPGTSYQPYHIRLGNIPSTWIDGWIQGVQKIYYPEQWYLKD